MAGLNLGRAARAGMAFVALWIASGSGEIRAQETPDAEEGLPPTTSRHGLGEAAPPSTGGPSSPV